MERRSLWASALALAGSLALMAGSASAHGTVMPAGTRAESANCKIYTLPGLMRQGEFGNVGSVGDVVSVECNPLVYPGGTQVELSDAQLQSRCEGLGREEVEEEEDFVESFHGIVWLDPNEFSTGTPRGEAGGSITVELDGDGNVNVGLVAGPNCAVGGTVISGHTQPGKGNTTVESFAAGFAVEPAKPSPEGVTVDPLNPDGATQVEDEESSSVAALLQVEFPSSEAKVRVAAPELFSRCEVAPGGDPEGKVIWLRPDLAGFPFGVTGEGRELAGGTSVEPGGDEALRTDNDGNAFVIALGAESCKPGKSYFEVDEEESPFTTEEPAFTILPPQPTEY